MPLKQKLPTVSNGMKNEIQMGNVYYKSIVENNSFFIVKTDLRGNYTYMNPYFCERQNIKAADYLGKGSLCLILPEDHASCMKTVEKCFAEPHCSHWVNLNKPCERGDFFTRWEFKLVNDEVGNPVEILCVGHEITHLILKQKELQQLVDITSEQNERLKNFTYIVSHNIRSHVANIVGILDIDDLMASEEERRMAWGILKESAASLDQTLHNLHEILSIQSHTNLPFTSFNVYQEINRVVKSIEFLMDQAETSIHYNFNKEEIINSNTAYFESIILNLLTNAIKYKSYTRRLEINLGLVNEGKFKVITFKDNGSGIDLKRFGEEMFGMYKRFHGNKDARGLGLFIIKTQIEAMKGKIEVESEVGIGTAFKLHFPYS